jgi:hypothetical protein
MDPSLGFDAAPPADVPVRAGSVTAVLRGIDLAHVVVGSVELTRLVYVAIRDELWNTIPPRVSDLRLTTGNDSFDLVFTARHTTDMLDFEWSGRIQGGTDGTISYEMAGAALCRFRYGRIGLCVLHLAAAHAGRAYRAYDGAGVREGVFPVAVFPQRVVDGVYVPAVEPFTRLDVDLESGAGASFRFEGDQFEIEDQRNWTDAAFKTYSTPLRFGLTHEATAGRELRQRVEIAHRTVQPTASGRRRGSAATGSVEVLLLEPREAAWPAVGIRRAGQAPSEAGARALGRLGLQHERVDVDVTGSAPEDTLRRILAGACPGAVELALTVTEESLPRVADFLAMADHSAPIARILVFHPDQEVSLAGLVERVRDAARSCGIDAPVGGGTELWFAELNRNNLVEGLEALAFSVTPKFHLSDDESMFETLPIQALVVDAARTLYPGIPIAVTPITLSVRNIFAVRAGHPEEADPRQHSLFAAAWTAGSLVSLSGAAANSLTYFELAGPGGLVPGRGHAGKEAVYPAYHVLADACQWAMTPQLRTVTTDPESVTVGGSVQGGRVHLWLVNLRPVVTRVSVGPFAPNDWVTMRTLDELSVAEATAHPDSFRARSCPVSVQRGTIDLELRPYAVCTIHCKRE